MKIVILIVLAAGISSAETAAPSGWSWQNPQPTGNTLSAVAVLDVNTVVAEGTILRTGDSGATWTQPFSGTTEYLRAISFINANTGTVVGSGGTILRTTDGGRTWTRQPASVDYEFYGVSFTDADTGTVVGCDSPPTTFCERGMILRAKDGGLTWTTQFSSAAVRWFTGVSFTDANTGTAVVAGGVILRTADGGTNW